MTREQRLAENEVLFRRVNERIRELEQGWDLKEIDFMCECADVACTQVLTMTVAEYEQLRSEPTHFAVLPGHQIEEIERVVETHPAYLVVEKHVETQEQAREADPRYFGGGV